MCGHGVIALAKVLLDTGMPRQTGRRRRSAWIRRRARHGDRAADQRRGNLGVLPQRAVVRLTRSTRKWKFPAWVVCAMTWPLAAPSRLRRCRCGWRGLAAATFAGSSTWGCRSNAVMASLPIEHPFEPDLGFLRRHLRRAAGNPQHHSRNVCMFADGGSTASPTGTGVSAGCPALRPARSGSVNPSSSRASWAPASPAR